RSPANYRIPAGSVGTSNAVLRPKSSSKPAWLDASAGTTRFRQSQQWPLLSTRATTGGFKPLIPLIILP
ncbi:hypothetical protein PspLS_02416, partial [Pyricularia sp. CBS 133598]